MVTMVDLIVTPRLRRLEMPNIPKILRTHLTARLQAWIMKESLICPNHICKFRTLLAYSIWICCSWDLVWTHATPTALRLLHPATLSQLFGYTFQIFMNLSWLPGMSQWTLAEAVLLLSIEIYYPCFSAWVSWRILSFQRFAQTTSSELLPSLASDSVNSCHLSLSMLPRDTLTRLEIDHSLRTTDALVPDMVKLHNLRLLSMAGTTLSCEALAIILLGLKNLVSLPNGDFLCDVLEWLAYESPEEVWNKGWSSIITFTSLHPLQCLIAMGGPIACLSLLLKRLQHMSCNLFKSCLFDVSQGNVSLYEQQDPDLNIM